MCRYFVNFLSVRIFAKEVVDKVKELDEEKKKTEKAFHDFLPPSVVKDIKNKKVNLQNIIHFK